MKKFGFALIISLFLPLTVRAQTPMEPQHIAKLQAALNAVISPDGTQVAYNLSVPRQPLEDKDGSAWIHLYVVDQQGNARPYITGEEVIGAPQWTADGSAILYTARRGEDNYACLYRIPIDGGESQRVLEHDTSIGQFSMSPSGQQIAYLANAKEDPALKDLKDSGFNQEIFEEDWQPTRVWIASLAEQQTDPRALELPGSASLAKWNHAGSHLAVVLAPTPSVDSEYMAKKVYVVDAVSGEITCQVEHAAKLGDVQWSPNGDYLAMLMGDDIHDPKEGRLMIAATSGKSAPRNLLPDYQGHITSFAWQSDRTIIWTGAEGTLTRLGSVSLDGSSSTRIEPNADVGIFGEIRLSRLGSTATMLLHARRHYDEVYFLNLENGDPQRLTNSNPWLADIQFCRQETISWNASDGLELQGVLVYPANYQSGQRYPMIMVVHGGPEAHESDGWITAYSKPGQMGAARGFFVFYPNYRGSTGRGVEFSKLGQAAAAQKEFSDLVDGIDYLSDQGLIDSKKVGITGGSYGGYASAWGSTFYSDRYAASVMFVGISDNVSKVGTTDIPEEMYLVHHRKRLWDDWDYFLKSSPIRYVERNKTPTLILHGKEDPRVHPSQSLELHRHLKTLGQAPVRLVLYEGEGHGNRKAAARLDYCLRQIRWMEHYLQGPGGAAPEMHIDYRAALGLEPEEEVTTP